MIPQWKKDRCKWCADEWKQYPEAVGFYHMSDPSAHPSNRAYYPCTAPTESAYIEELEARLKESGEDTARYRLAIGEIAWISITESHQEAEIYHICYKAITQFKGDGLEQETAMRAAIDAARIGTK